MGNGGSSSSTEVVDSKKIFGLNGRLVNISTMLEIQKELENKYPRLSDPSEQEKTEMRPKLFKLYDLIDAWRNDIDLIYRDGLKRMQAAADHNRQVPEQICGALVSLVCLLPGLYGAATAVELSNLLKKTVSEENDAVAFSKMTYDAAKLVMVIGSNVTSSYQKVSTFEGVLLETSKNMRRLLCSPTEEEWKALRLLANLRIDTDLQLYNEIRTTLVDHTRSMIYGYIFSINFDMSTQCMYQEHKGGRKGDHIWLFDKKGWTLTDEGVISEIEGFMRTDPKLFWEGTVFERCKKGSYNPKEDYQNTYHPRIWRGMVVYARYAPDGRCGRNICRSDWCICSNCCDCGKYPTILK